MFGTIIETALILDHIGIGGFDIEFLDKGVDIRDSGLFVIGILSD